MFYSKHSIYNTFLTSSIKVYSCGCTHPWSCEGSGLQVQRGWSINRGQMQAKATVAKSGQNLRLVFFHLLTLWNASAWLRTLVKAFLITRDLRMHCSYIKTLACFSIGVVRRYLIVMPYIKTLACFSISVVRWYLMFMPPIGCFAQTMQHLRGKKKTSRRDAARGAHEIKKNAGAISGCATLMLTQV